MVHGNNIISNSGPLLAAGVQLVPILQDAKVNYKYRPTCTSFSDEFITHQFCTCGSVFVSNGHKTRFDGYEVLEPL